MTEKMNTVLLIAIVVLLVVILIRPSKVGRFQPVPEDIWVALDTRTGRLCSTTEGDYQRLGGQPILHSCGSK